MVYSNDFTYHMTDDNNRYLEMGVSEELKKIRSIVTPWDDFNEKMCNPNDVDQEHPCYYNS